MNRLLVAALACASSVIVSLPGMPSAVANASTAGRWHISSPLGPNSKGEHVAAYDPIANRMIIFGGIMPSTGNDETWELSLNGEPTWTLLAQTTKPSGRSSATMVYDSRMHRMLLFGGYDSNYRNDVWQLSLGTTPQWSLLPVTGTPPTSRHWASGIFDPIRNRMVIIGGYRGGPEFNDVWALNLDPATPSWQQLFPSGGIPTVYGAAIVYDTARDRALITGSNLGSNVMALDLGNLSWSSVSTGSTSPGAQYSSAVYDPDYDRMLVFGGLPASNVLWELNLSDAAPQWQQLSPDGPTPIARYTHSGVLQTGEHRMINFGGRGPTSEPNLNEVVTLEWPTVNLPAVSTFQPKGGLPGDPITILGFNLLNVTQVLFNGTAAPILGRTLTTIQTQIPNGATTGPVVVTNPYGSDTSSVEFFVGPAPQIFSATPDSGGFLAEVHVFGDAFTGVMQVKIGPAASSFTLLSDDELIALVQVGSATGAIQVANPTGTATSSFLFKVITPQIHSAQPDSGAPGDTIEIHGRGLFGATSVEVGGECTTFSVQSDTLIAMVLDTSVVTGPISVTNPVGTGLSSFTFTVLKNPRPVLIRIKDVPADQGGLVVLHWLKSYYDRAGYDRITGYRVWRRSILPTANAGLTTPLALQEAGEFWEAIGQFPAAFLQGYAFAAPTLVDSTELASPYTAFAVQAFTANAFEFYFSNVDSGYSVDNLAPAAPLEFVANHSGPNRVVLRWRGSRENDFSTYVLHRGASADFTPAPENLLTSTTDTTVVDGAPLSGMRFYKVAGVDVHGNVGAYSSASPEPPVSTLASLVEAQARPGWARIEWLWNGDASARPTLFRREPRGDWQSLGEVLANHERRIIVEDHPTKSGEHGYQLRLGDRIVAEAWVNVPGAELAIESLAPNPARGSITLSAILQGVPARIEAFDVRGRRALSREIGTLTGRQQITIPEAAQLPAGVYVLRLTAGGRSLTRRFLIVR